MLGLLYEVPEYYFLPATWTSRNSDVRERHAARGLPFATPRLLFIITFVCKYKICCGLYHAVANKEVLLFIFH